MRRNFVFKSKYHYKLILLDIAISGELENIDAWQGIENYLYYSFDLKLSK